MGAQPAVLRQQQPVEGLGHAPGGRRGVVVQRQRLEAGPRRQAAVGAVADTVGEGEQVALAGGQFRRGGDQAQGVLVLLPRSGGAGLGEAQAQAHTRAAVTAAEPQVVRQRSLTPCRPNQASKPRLANSHRPNW